MELHHTTFLETHITLLSKKDLLARITEWLKEKERQFYIVTPNPEIVLHSIRDEKFRKALKSADISIADGFGLKFAAWVLGTRIRERIAGVDLMADILKLAEEQNYTVGLLGGENSVAQQAQVKLQKFYPRLNIVYADCGIDKGQFSLLNTECVEAVTRAKPEILFVAFGAPKQELWIYHNLKKMPSVQLAMAVGGSMDYYAGIAKRAAWLWRALGLEWLYRLWREPRRWRRILTAIVIFPLTVLWWKLRIGTTYRKNVSALILNKDRKILMVAGARYEDIRWQLPQGGMEQNENPFKAVIREMSEELGTDKFKILKHILNYYRYRWPHSAQIIQGYKGQRQDLFIMEFLGTDADFNLEKEGELKKFRWLDMEEALKLIEPVRREGLVRALGYV